MLRIGSHRASISFLNTNYCLMNLLLSSNSTLHGEPYLQFCKDEINSFLAAHQVKNVVFIPFAAVGFTYDEYESNVVKGLDNSAIELKGVHRFEDKIKAVEDADAIVTGGGNTFHLLHEVYRFDLIEAIRAKVNAGAPYVGWSAGSNLACPTVKTTNDMPIIYPPSFDALNLVPFQINPHYIHGNPPGHNGETREQRIKEFLEVNQDMTVVGLREGSMFKIEDESIQLIGDRDARIFKYDQEYYELNNSSDYSFLL